MSRLTVRRPSTPLVVAVLAVLVGCVAVSCLALGSVFGPREPGEPLRVVPNLPIAKGTVVVAAPLERFDPVYLTLTQGLLSQRGYTVVVRETPGLAEAAGLVARGEADLVPLPSGQAALVYEQGADVLLAAPCLAGRGALVAPVAAVIGSVGDLRGKRIAMVYHSLAAYELRATMQARGVDLEREARLVPLSRAEDAGLLLERGDADLALLTTPFDAQMLETGRYKVIEGVATGWEAVFGADENVHCTWLANLASVARLPFIRSDLGDVQRQIAAIMAEPERYSALVQALTAQDADWVFVSRQLLGSMPPSRLTPDARRGLLERFQTLYRAGYLRSDLWEREPAARWVFGPQ